MTHKLTEIPVGSSCPPAMMQCNEAGPERPSSQARCASREGGPPRNTPEETPRDMRKSPHSTNGGARCVAPQRTRSNSEMTYVGAAHEHQYQSPVSPARHRG